MDMEDENKTETQEKPQELTEDFFSDDYTGDYESDNDVHFIFSIMSNTICPITLSSSVSTV